MTGIYNEYKPILKTRWIPPKVIGWGGFMEVTEDRYEAQIYLGGKKVWIPIPEPFNPGEKLYIEVHKKDPPE